MKTIKTGIGILVMIGMAALYGCGSQNANSCFAVQAGLCAASFNPKTDPQNWMLDLSKCTTSAAQACGVANPPTPVSVPQMMAQHPAN